VRETWRLTALADEKARLKRLVAAPAWNNQAFKDLFRRHG
jgi:hypothetical protein